MIDRKTYGHSDADPETRARHSKMLDRAFEETKIALTVSDSRGVFTFEEWQKMPSEVPPVLKPWWKD